MARQVQRFPPLPPVNALDALGSFVGQKATAEVGAHMLSNWCSSTPLGAAAYSCHNGLSRGIVCDRQL